MDEIKPLIGIVVIGRNEAVNLKRCFQSLAHINTPKVYVDSASTDQSLAIAKSFEGIQTIVLTNNFPLTAARGRNEGFFHLTHQFPSIEYVQFIDGDCHLEEGWLEAAKAKMEENKDVGLVNGILKELNPTLSPFKQVTALEWEMPSGEVNASGGNCFVRTKVFRELGGFNIEIPAAEDTEFCLRLRLRGWKIWHLHRPMAVHDTRVVTFLDFCKRSRRTGYAFSHVAWLHRHSPEKLFFRENLSTIFYGGILPLLSFGLAYWTGGYSLLLLFLYPLLLLKIYYSARKTWDHSDAWLYAASCVIAKFPGFIGSCQFYLTKIIEFVFYRQNLK